MRRAAITGLIVAACGLAAGCASTPDVGITYYLPKSDGALVVTRTLRCDVANNLIVASAVTPRVEQSANTADRWTIRLAELDSIFANADPKFQLYPDGRLKGLNTSSTGQAGEILKSAISLAGSVLGAAGVLRFDTSGAPGPQELLCDYINSNKKDQTGTKDRSQSLVLTFGGNLDLAKGAETPSADLKATPYTEVALFQITNIIGPNHLGLVGARMMLKQESGAGTNEPPAKCAPEISGAPVTCRTSRPDDILIKLRRARGADIAVTLGKNVQPFGFYETLNTSVQLSQHGEPYYVPIPKAALFGKQTFTLSVSESGAITEIGYGKETGAGQVLGVGKAVFDQLAPTTAADKVAATKAEADLIAQQQRLARCQADPATCQ